MEKDDHDLLMEIHQAIFGCGGEGGCFNDCKQLKRDFYKFRLAILVAIAFAGGMGGFGLSEILKVVAGW